MEEALSESLREFRESLDDVEALLADDPDNEELRRVRSELQDSIRQAEESLVEIPANVIPTVKDTSHDEPGSTAIIGPSVPDAGLESTVNGSTSHQTAKRGDARRNPRIHPRNLYAAAEPDFAALAKKDAGLAPLVRVDERGRGSVDFKDPAANRELTRALLKHDFGIEWKLPPGQLIPAVTNRANYIHWLQDLLNLASPPGEEVCGLDIGCGANLIYCLLGAKICGWRMVGVDVTAEAAAGANDIISLNPGLAGLIEVRIKPVGLDSRLKEGIILPAVAAGERFTFTMCNPPFFGSIEEASRNPATAFQGTASEMVCQGGEHAFVMQMVEDSQLLGDRVFWYTSMVGKKSTLKLLRLELHKRGVTALRATEFAQGRTSRWGLAWSFDESARASSGAQLLRNPAAAQPRVARKQTIITIHSRSLQPLRVLEVLSEVLKAHGAACKIDASAFRLTAEVTIVSEASDSPKVKRQKTGGGGGGGGYVIMAAVLMERPGVLAIQAKVPSSSSEAVARSFTDFMQAADRDLRQILGLAE